jgi:hypothetical protein
MSLRSSGFRFIGGLLFKFKASGEGTDLGDEAAPARLKDAALRVRKALHLDLSQFVQIAFQAREPFVQLLGGPLQRRGALRPERRLWPPGARLAKKRLLRDLVRGRPVSGQKRLGLVGVEAMPLDRVGERNLPGSGKGAQPQGRGQPQAAHVQPRLKRRGEVPRELEPALDPLLAAAQDLSDGGQGPARLLLLGIGEHDARLVHGAQGPRGRVGLQNLRPGGEGRGGFEDDRDLAQALGSPPREPLEPVDDLAGSVFQLHHAQRQRRERRRLAARRALPAQSREPSPQLFDRDLFQERHGFSSPFPSSGSN